MKLVIYPGTFDPYHIGHENIRVKAIKIYGNGSVQLAIGINPAKPATNTVERAKKLCDKLQDADAVISYSCFLHEYIMEMREKGFDVVLLRGVRNGEDIEHEENQLAFMQDLEPRLKFRSNVIFGFFITNKFLLKLIKPNVVFLRPDEEYKHISSSAIRQLESFRLGSAKQFII